MMDEDDIVEQPIYAISEKPYAAPYSPAADYHSNFRGSSIPIVIDNGKLQIDASFCIQ
jgi:hypothetical protein